MTLRRIEPALLALCAAFAVLAFAALALAPAARLSDWGEIRLSWQYGVSLALWGAACLGGQAVLARQLPRRDPLIFPAVMFLAVWGMALVWRLAPAFGLRQAFWVVVGTVGMLAVVVAPVDLRWLRRYRYLWLGAALVLTTLTLLLGINPSGGGPALWLGCCGVYFQPSEALKVLLVVYLATYFADKGEGAHAIQATPALLAPVFLMWGFSLLLLVSQRDLGTGSLVFAVFIAMLYFAIGQRRYAIVGGLLLAAGAAISYFLFDVVRLRIDAWFDPFVDPSGRSFQIVQSLIAVASGGLFGRGFGIGSPTVIPVVHSDFVYAAIVEEWGLIGGVAAIALLAVIVLRGLRIAALARGPFRRLLAGGLSSLMGLQSILIIGGVIKVLPLTGVTLPFLSYGGSSMLAHFIIIGLLLKLSADRGERNPLAEPSQRDTVYYPTVFFVLSFVALAVAAGYWGLIDRESLVTRADNPRILIAYNRIHRGTIVDRHNAPLAITEGVPGDYVRRYPVPSAAPVIGYASFRHGLSGIEAAADDALTGVEGASEFDVWWRYHLLGMPRPGHDVRLTLDATLQESALEALGDNAGAIVIVETGTGDILAMVSAPTFNPATIDNDFDSFTADDKGQLVNRATEALYAPGRLLDLYPPTLEPPTPVLPIPTSGDGRNRVTPLQMALLTAAAANGGEMPAPRLIESVCLADSCADDSALWARREATGHAIAVLPATLASELLQMFEAQADQFELSYPGYFVTAAGNGGNTNGWFIGLMNNGGWAVAVLLEQATGLDAAKVAAAIR